MEDLKKGILVKNGVCVGALGDKYFSTAPIGVIQAFSGQTAPHGYLLCDGASYKVADYSDLYAVIGNTYGGDSTNFNVPNLVDKFIQGSTTSGEEKEAGLPNITGSFVPWAYQNSLNPSGAFSQSYTNVSAYDEYGANKGSQINFNASQSNSIYGNSDTVQPPALTMVYIIKAFHTNEGVDSNNEVSDPIIEYVEGEIAKVDTELKGNIEELSSNLGELCNKKIYCGEVTGTTVNGVISTINPIGKVGNVIATMKYANDNPRGYSVTAQTTLTALNFYFRWHRESDDVEAYPPDGTEITISYMIFY